MFEFNEELIKKHHKRMIDEAGFTIFKMLARDGIVEVTKRKSILMHPDRSRYDVSIKVFKKAK